MEKIAVIGLGKLGLCSALCFAKSGHDVQGYDSSLKVINNIKNKRFDNYEPKVIDYLKKYRKFKFSNKFSDILNYKNIFVILPTPSQKNYAFSNKYIYSFLETYTDHCKKKNIKNFHIIISSTIMPNSSNEFINFIEKKTELKVNEDFYFSYNPEFIALGNVIENFLNPDFVLIGSSHQKAANKLIKIYKKTVKTKNYHQMSLTSSEITKICLNSFITLKISFANLILRISDKFKDANAQHIAKAIGNDQRVSPYYFKPGLPFGGPCFPRDNEAFNFLQKIIKLKNSFITGSTINSNKEHIVFLNKKIISLIKSKKYKNICIAGIAFKKDTSVTERSYGIVLADLFIKNKIKFCIYEINYNKNDLTIKKYSKYIIKKSDIKKSDLIINTNSYIFPKNSIPVVDLWNL
jgi:UDPglucose 6-dehydrogenase